jgi:hypothetical protein
MNSRFTSLFNGKKQRMKGKEGTIPHQTSNTYMPLLSKNFLSCTDKAKNRSKIRKFHQIIILLPSGLVDFFPGLFLASKMKLRYIAQT